MNAIQAHETTLWNRIPYDIRKSISDSASHGGFEALHYILIGTPMWNDRENIIATLHKLGYETGLTAHAGDGKGNIIEYILKIYWNKPRKITY